MRFLEFWPRREIIPGARIGQETESVELENDFPEVLARLHHAMRRRRVRGRDYLVNWRTQPAGFESRAELLEERRDDPRLLGGWACAQSRAEDFQMTAQNGGQIELGARMRNASNASSWAPTSRSTTSAGLSRRL